MMQSRLVFLVLALCSVVGCSAPDGGALDAAAADTGVFGDGSRDGSVVPGRDGAVAARCTSDIDCNDGLFCNGAERCAPAAPGAPASGCVAGDPPCSASETCDEARNDCQTTCVDVDGDGARASSCGGTDCDDSDSNRYPGNVETCDMHDEDCNPDTFGFVDADMDGAGSSRCCNGTQCGTDCDDANASRGPAQIDGPPDRCNAIDDDCDGQVDEGCPCTSGSESACYTGEPAATRNVGRCREGRQLCVNGMRQPTCIDEITPIAERCNGVDDDCDGATDENVKLTYYRDADQDGFGNAMLTVEDCSPPMGYVANATDCDDADRARNPGNPEVCNGRDDNCNSMTDEGVTQTVYPDMDGDGYGARGMGTAACFAGMRQVANGLDCNDASAAVSPAAPEACDGALDDDCDGSLDEGCQCTDGATMACAGSSTGECKPGTQRCIAGRWSLCVGRVESRAELCNGLDDDCNGTLDNGFACRAGQSMACNTACGTPGTQLCASDCSGYLACRAATETCNGCDDDVDGAVDEGFACRAGALLDCMTPCGTRGFGVCTAACALPTGTACRATVESCNYCDDDGDGTFYDEQGVAIDQVGKAYSSCLADVDIATRTEPCLRRNYDLDRFGVLQLSDGTTFNGRWGGAIEPTRGTVRAGYGPTRVNVTVLAAPGSAFLPGTGWALVITRESGAAVGPGSVGIPYDRRGIAVTWRFHGASPAAQADELLVEELDASGAGRFLASYPVPAGFTLDAAGESVLQPLELRFTVDNPATIFDESAVTLSIAGTPLTASSVSGLDSIRPGDLVYVNVVSGTGPMSNARVDWLIAGDPGTESGGPPAVTIVATGTCPP